MPNFTEKSPARVLIEEQKELKSLMKRKRHEERFEAKPPNFRFCNRCFNCYYRTHIFGEGWFCAKHGHQIMRNGMVCDDYTKKRMV